MVHRAAGRREHMEVMRMNGIELGMRQQLAITPQLQQALRLLQLSAFELDEELERVLATNPLLEEDPDAVSRLAGERQQEAVETSIPDDADDRDRSVDSFTRVSGPHDEDTDWSEWTEAETSLRDHLRGQLLLSQMPDRERALALLLIDTLDDDGYLRIDLAELLALVPDAHEVTVDELGAILRLVQTLEPAGIAARSLDECLQLQLAGLPDETPGLPAARAIVRQFLPQLARCEFAKLQQAIGCSEAEVSAALKLIRSLEPRPGDRYGADKTRYVVPDVIVGKAGGHWSVTLNPSALPRIRVNHAYAAVISSRSYAGTQLSQQLQEARWLMRSLGQRSATIQRVAEAIVTRQKRFLEYGDVAMRPLTMKQIAAELALHESTVCRTVSGKYMATPSGVFEFRRFFSQELVTSGGSSYSATAVRAVLKELIAHEDPHQPLSDARLADLLGEQGLQVARRTVSKYRNLMRLPTVERRLARVPPGSLSTSAADLV
ncbi:MAG: RNA polymerase factor sigma-54 [Candidatus Accumulibacter sp. UW20]|jgi:RNA polymerase sigma-54 factor